MGRAPDGGGLSDLDFGDREWSTPGGPALLPARLVYKNHHSGEFEPLGEFRTWLPGVPPLGAEVVVDGVPYRVDRVVWDLSDDGPMGEGERVADLHVVLVDDPAPQALPIPEPARRRKPRRRGK